MESETAGIGVNNNFTGTSLFASEEFSCFKTACFEFDVEVLFTVVVFTCLDEDFAEVDCAAANPLIVTINTAARITLFMANIV